MKTLFVKTGECLPLKTNRQRPILKARDYAFLWMIKLESQLLLQESVKSETHTFKGGGAQPQYNCSVFAGGIPLILMVRVTEIIILPSFDKS